MAGSQEHQQGCRTPALPQQQTLTAQVGGGGGGRGAPDHQLGGPHQLGGVGDHHQVIALVLDEAGQSAGHQRFSEQQ